MERSDVMQGAREKTDAAFELLRVLDLPFFTFHDRDVAPEGDNLQEYIRNFHEMADYIGTKMQSSKARLLWVRRTCSRIHVSWRERSRILTPTSLHTARPQ